MQFNGTLGELLLQSAISPQNASDLQVHEAGELRIFWCWEGQTELVVDGVNHVLAPDQLIFLTEFHQVQVNRLSKGGLFKFNASFYCLDQHDGEVGCKGALFYGPAPLSAIQLPEEDREIFHLLWRVFTNELQARDNLQLEMLRMLMKRWMILCIRMFKRQHWSGETEDHKLQVIKDFCILVEQHFRELHTVKDYAHMLHKSPKTLAHIFGKSYSQSPLQVIQNRILLEARRQLLYSDKSIKELAYWLGFSDIQSFSRFFTHHSGQSPKAFREQMATAQGSIVA